MRAAEENTVVNMDRVLPQRRQALLKRLALIANNVFASYSTVHVYKGQRQHFAEGAPSVLIQSPSLSQLVALTEKSGLVVFLQAKLLRAAQVTHGQNVQLQRIKPSMLVLVPPVWSCQLSTNCIKVWTEQSKVRQP